jgi:hypothetical protein
MNASMLILAACLLAILPILYVIGYALDLAWPPRRAVGHCSFCCKSYRDVGPLVEGPRQAYICYGCTQKCLGIIQRECDRLGKPVPTEPKEVGEPV